MFKALGFEASYLQRKCVICNFTHLGRLATLGHFAATVVGIFDALPLGKDPDPHLHECGRTRPGHSPRKFQSNSTACALEYGLYS